MLLGTEHVGLSFWKINFYYCEDYFKIPKQSETILNEKEEEIFRRITVEGKPVYKSLPFTSVKLAEIA